MLNNFYRFDWVHLGKLAENVYYKFIVRITTRFTIFLLSNFTPLIGYWLYVAGSCLYFAQALNPFLKSYNTQDDIALEYKYYYYGPESKDEASPSISITAAVIFIVESALYILGLYLARSYGDSATLSAFYLDW